MTTKYYFLKVPQSYLFWYVEESPRCLHITITEEIVEKIDKKKFPYSDDLFSGYYYNEHFGWEIVYRQSIRISEKDFELICSLDKLSDITKRMDDFFRNAVKDLFENADLGKI